MITNKQLKMIVKKLLILNKRNIIFNLKTTNHKLQQFLIINMISNKFKCQTKQANSMLFVKNK